MADIKKNKANLITTISLVVFGLLILAGIIYFAWNRTGSTTTGSTNDRAQTTTDTTTSAAAVDQLGANETKLTPDNYDAFTKQAGVVLVDVYSPTCPHCIKIAPILTELSNEYVGKVHIGKLSVGIDANRNFILAREKDFAYVPAIWIYKDGVVKESFTGEKTKDEFKALLDKYL